jgi:hypothetical protein
MKAKILVRTMVCFLLIAVMPSCQKNFLDRNPLSKISSQTFWKTDADVQQGLIGVYSTLQAGFYSTFKVYLDAYSDNAYDRYGNRGFDQLTRGLVTPVNVTSDFYNPPYRAIAACNYFLDNAPKAAISSTALNEYAAEARFIRAMCYFDLVQAFGGVVLYKTSPLTVADSKIAQSSATDVLAFVNSELDFAIANLPDQLYSKTGHAVKASALAEKARVALFQKNWALAMTLTRQIINSHIYSLDADYNGLFLTATQQTSKEIIFSTKYLAPNNTGNFESGDGSQAGGNTPNPYQNLVDEYETAGGKMITDPTSGYDPTRPYANRDPRQGMTIHLPNDIWHAPDGTVFTPELSLTGYGPKKYVDLSHIPFNKNLGDQNVIHIRYADVLLMYAEAKNEANGPDQSIYDALNLIRQRPSVNLPPVNQALYNSQATLRDFVRHERRIELAMEGHRYYDLKRWGIMQQTLSKLKNPGGVQLKFGEINNVLPFAQSELIANPQLKQNQGY